MNIYELDNSKLRKVLLKFIKTNYGKIVFLLAYSLPTVSFLGLFVILMMNKILGIYSLVFGIIDILLTLVTFVLGSRYYYHEVKNFIDKNVTKKN